MPGAMIKNLYIRVLFATWFGPTSMFYVSVDCFATD